MNEEFKDTMELGQSRNYWRAKAVCAEDQLEKFYKERDTLLGRFRLAELKGAKVIAIDADSVADQYNKVREMSEEEFQVYKDELIERQESFIKALNMNWPQRLISNIKWKLKGE